jgi:penicillin-binding protein 1A
MATGYGVFANGGYYVPPTLITRITDHRGKVLLESPAPTRRSQRVISPRNAFVMSQLLQEITRSGTAARAQATLKRPTCMARPAPPTTRSMPGLSATTPPWSAAAWVGYDNPRNLGSRKRVAA